MSHRDTSAEVSWAWWIWDRKVGAAISRARGLALPLIHWHCSLPFFCRGEARLDLGLWGRARGGGMHSSDTSEPIGGCARRSVIPLWPTLNSTSPQLSNTVSPSHYGNQGLRGGSPSPDFVATRCRHRRRGHSRHHRRWEHRAVWR